MSAPRTPRRVAAGAATATLLLLAATACGGGGQPDDAASKSANPHGRSHESPSKPASSQSSSGSTASAVPVYYLGDTKAGVRLFREFHKVRDGDASGLLLKALQLAVRDSADDPDYHTGWPQGTKVEGAGGDRRHIQITLSGPNLSKRPAGMSAAEARQALNALVFTADGVWQANAPVYFTTPDARPMHQILGIRVGESFPRANPDKVKSTVSVFSPTQGATVASPFKVTGEAATFEANVVWELMQGDKVVKHGFTTAKECCTLAPYSFTVKAPPGKYTLVVHDTNEATGEGVGSSQDTKDITVR